MRPLAGLQGAVFLLNSRMGRLAAPPADAGGPLLPKLRGCFAEFLNGVCLARLGTLMPSHLCRFRVRTGGASRGAFSRRRAAAAPRPGRARAACGRFRRALPRPLPRALAHTPPRRGNVGPLPVGYGFRPGLRFRLTPGGRTCPGKPWDSGDRDSHPVFRYSCPHNR